MVHSRKDPYPPPTWRKLKIPLPPPRVYPLEQTSINISLPFLNILRHFSSPLPGGQKFPTWWGHGSFRDDEISLLELSPTCLFSRRAESRSKMAR